MYCLFLFVLHGKYFFSLNPLAIFLVTQTTIFLYFLSATEIKGTLRLPNDESLNTTLVTLNSYEYSTYTKPDGTFTFYNVKPGVHLLDVHSPQYMFSHVKIQVTAPDEKKEDEESSAEVRCVQYAFVGGPKQAIPHPLIMTAHASYQYFEQKSGFSFKILLKNPMLLMMLFSAGLMFVMPKMMENLDDDQKEQMQRQMEMQSDPSKMLSQLWGDIAGGGEQQSQQSAVAAKKGSNKGGGKNTRRSKRD